MTTEPALATDQHEHWNSAGRALLAKLLAEFSYERLLTPELADAAPPPDRRRVGRGEPRPYRVVTPTSTYSFTARRGTFGTWWLDASSLRRTSRGDGEDVRAAADPVRFVVEARSVLGWPDGVVADVVGDLRATQRADARLAAAALPASDLADLGYRELDGHQTGHPCMVANKGRLGFSVTDAGRYCPEARSPFRLLWVAAHPDLASFHPSRVEARRVEARRGETSPSAGTTTSAPTALEATALLDRELDDDVRARFRTTLAATATGPSEEYVWLPVHPWQWDNVIAALYADEIARGRLVPLGESSDRYVPLQAIRTVANVDRPDRLDVKLALMIRNTLVWRGMSAADAEAGPVVSAWVVGLRDADEFLATTTRVLPQPEVAGAVVNHPAFTPLAAAPYRFHEMAGVLWREPVGTLVAPGETARAFACLLLVGADGRALVTELVARSGRSARVWLRALMRALFHPVLHYFYVYGIGFTPHGENVAIVFDAAGLPRRIAVKDFGADLGLVEGEFPERGKMPRAAAEHLRPWPPALLAHSVLSAIVAGHFRYFSVLVADHLDVGEDEFWGLVRDTVEDYQRQFPAYAERFAAVDLFAPTFGRVCLNAEQLAGAGFHDRPDRDGAFDILRGEVANPLYRPPVSPP